MTYVASVEANILKATSRRSGSSRVLNENTVVSPEVGIYKCSLDTLVQASYEIIALTSSYASSTHLISVDPRKKEGRYPVFLEKQVKG